MLEWLASGGDAERYEIAFDKGDYTRHVKDIPLWTPRWFNAIPNPLAIRTNLGHGGEGVCDEARGFELPCGWTQSLVHGSKLAF